MAIKSKESAPSRSLERFAALKEHCEQFRDIVWTHTGNVVKNLTIYLDPDKNRLCTKRTNPKCRKIMKLQIIPKSGVGVPVFHVCLKDLDTKTVFFEYGCLGIQRDMGAEGNVERAIVAWYQHRLNFDEASNK